jgi:SAM-dependent methyltransferase
MPAYSCPLHRCTLVADSAAYRCPGGHTFPIVRGIARFVDSEDYTGSFGRQWNRFRLTQLDSHVGLPLSEQRALRCLGMNGRVPNQASLLQGESVLEVGCGAGRFTEVLLNHGAAVTSVDLSSAVEANAVNFPPNVTHRIAQADVRALPFAARQFDGVLCLGVIQHTPDPERTIAALYEQVRPGGWLAFDHYASGVGMATWIGGHTVRRVFRHVPLERRLSTVENLVDRLLPLHACAARRGRLALKLLSRLSPVLSYYHIHPQLPERLQRDWAVLDTHDALTDTFKHRRNARTLRSYLIDLGLTDVQVIRAGNGIEARGRRPAQARTA